MEIEYITVYRQCYSYARLVCCEKAVNDVDMIQTVQWSVSGLNMKLTQVYMMNRQPKRDLS